MTFKEFKVKEGNRLYQAGTKVLSNRELITFIIRDYEAAGKVIEKYDSLIDMTVADIGELTELIGKDKAEQLQAALELGVRLSKDEGKDKTLVNDSIDVANLCRDMKYLQQEELRVLLLDAQNKVERMFMASRGTLVMAVLGPREVFAPAIANRAAGVVCVHNHPAQQKNPSDNDVEVTKTLARVGDMVGIPLIDHIIVCGNEHYSFKDSLPRLFKTSI